MKKWLVALSILLIIPSIWAQGDDFFSPPDIQPPPWINESSPKPNVPPVPSKGTPTSPSPNNAPPEGFWGEPQEESGGAFGSFAPAPSGPPKNSFQLTEPVDGIEEDETGSCIGWGHPLLGVQVYEKDDSCEFQLGKKVETSKQSVRSLEDRTRSLILKEVIAGKVTRQESKKVELRYDLLMDVLSDAKVEGCRCLN